MASYGGEWRMGWARYVPVADRIRNGEQHATRLAKQGRALRPVLPSGRGRVLASTFWGRAWCDNLAAYAVLSNRLERGRSYLRIAESVMAQVCRQGRGLFPAPAEIAYDCTCPDGFGDGRLCKHVAATFYGVGVRLDEDPELLFRLRRVAHADLLMRATAGLAAAPLGPPRSPRDCRRPDLRRLRDRPRGWPQPARASRARRVRAARAKSLPAGEIH